MASILLAGCVVLDQNGAILLLHRNTEKQHWEIPGGKVEPGESLEQAALREVKEELDVVATLIRQLGAARFTEDKHFTHHWFLAKLHGQPVVAEPEKFDDIAYFLPQQLRQPGLSLSNGVQHFLRQLDSQTIVLP